MSGDEINEPLDPEKGATQPLTGGQEKDSPSPAKIKFTGAGVNGEGPSVEMPIDTSTSSAGLRKEDLQPFMVNPFWVRVRSTLFFTFWILWFGVFFASIAIIAAAPRCPVKEGDNTTTVAPVDSSTPNSS